RLPGRSRRPAAVALPGVPRRGDGGTHGAVVQRRLATPLAGSGAPGGGPREGERMTREGLEISWPAERLGEALEALGRRCRLGVRPATVEAPPAGIVRAGGEGLDRWLEAAAGWLGLETEPVEVPYAEVEPFLLAVGPALLRLPGDAGNRF